MASLIPSNDNAKLVWAGNFKEKFAEVGANLGFTSEIEKVSAACDSVIFAVLLAQRAKAFSKACVIFRNAIFADKSGKIYKLPEFILPDVPPELITKNALAYLQRVIKRLKAQANYSSSLGVSLGIEATAASFSLTEAKPKGKTKSLTNSIVRIDWTKGKAHGVIVESQRGDETVWTTLDRDMYSPYIDTRPPLVAGKPEERRYRLRYFFNDERVGDYSLILTAITLP